MERKFYPRRDCKHGCNSLYAWRSEHGDSSNASVSNASSECRISNVSSADSQSLGVGVIQSTKARGNFPVEGEGETCQPSTVTNQRYKEADRETRVVKVDPEGNSCQTSTGCNADRDTG